MLPTLPVHASIGQSLLTAATREMAYCASMARKGMEEESSSRGVERRRREEERGVVKIGKKAGLPPSKICVTTAS